MDAKRLFDIGWSDVSQCQACQREEGTEKHRLYHCPEWHAARHSGSVQEMGAKGENIEVAKRYSRTPTQ